MSRKNKTPWGKRPPPSSEPQFAPAFAKKKKIDPYALEGDDDFAFTTTSNADVGGTWATQDVETGAIQYDSKYESGNARQAKPVWGDWTSPADHSTPADPLSIAPAVRDRFVGDAELMQHQKLSEFERRNRHALGLGGRSNVVRNIFDGKVQSVVETKVDHRIALMNADGTYKDGINRGMPKRRFLEEREARRRARDAEMLKANRMYLDWRNLPEAEKERRRREKAKIDELMSGLTLLEVDESIPEVYESRGTYYRVSMLILLLSTFNRFGAGAVATRESGDPERKTHK